MPNCGLAITLTHGAGVVWPGREDHDVLAAVAAEAAQAVEKRQIARSGSRPGIAGLEAASRGLRAGSSTSVRPRRSTCSGSVPASSMQDHAGHGLQQRPILFRHLLAAAHEDAAGLVHQRRFRAGGDEVHDRVLQRLAVDRVVLVPDDQVHAEALHPPVGVGLHGLAHQFDARRGRGCGPARSAGRRRCRNPTARIARGGCGSTRWPSPGAVREA